MHHRHQHPHINHHHREHAMVKCPERFRQLGARASIRMFITTLQAHAIRRWCCYICWSGARLDYLLAPVHFPQKVSSGAPTAITAATRKQQPHTQPCPPQSWGRNTVVNDSFGLALGYDQSDTHIIVDARFSAGRHPPQKLQTSKANWSNKRIVQLH